MLARRSTVVRKKRVVLNRPGLSPARTPTASRTILTHDGQQALQGRLAIAEGPLSKSSSDIDTVYREPGYRDTGYHVRNKACDDWERSCRWSGEPAIDDNYINPSQQPRMKIREESKHHNNFTDTVYINYHSTLDLPVSIKKIAIQNVKDDRNYFTYEAHDYVKAIDLDDVQHGGSAIVLQIREVNKEATTSCEFVYKVSSILCNSLAATVCLGVLIGIPVAMVSVGVKYLNECPKQPKIPIYLLVGGCFGLLFLLVVIWRQIQHRRFESLDGFDDVPGPDSGMDTKSSRVTDVILALFHIAWLILGTHWVFGIWTPHFSQLLHEPNNWCDKTMYMFAVFQILLCYSLFSLAFVVALCFCICYQVTVIFDTSVR